MSEAQIGVMLPARIETRFFSEPGQDEKGQPTNRWKMKIAVIPDEPWMNHHSDTVSQSEADHLRLLWAACQDDADILKKEEIGRAAFARFARQVGPARAWWLVNRFGPGAEIATGQKVFSRMDALPEQIEIWLGLRGGSGVELQRLEPPLTIHRDALLFAGEDGAALNLFGDNRWWTKDAGLQGEYTLPFTTQEELQTIECILAIGLDDSSPGDLFQSHRDAGRLSLLPPGAPTNTISGAPAADLAQDPDLWWQLLSSEGEAETIADVVLALAGQSANLKAMPGGTRAHRRLNSDLVTLLWPALWAHTLKDVWGVDNVLKWREKYDLGHRTFSFDLGLWAADNFHPEGPLAPLRIGDQPYGLWPVTRLDAQSWFAAASDPLVEQEWLLDWLAVARAQWASAAREHSGTVAGLVQGDGALRGADTDQFVRLLARTPTGSDYGYRTFLPMQVLYLLSRSLLSEDGAGPFAAWRDQAADWIYDVAKQLGLEVQPLRRYLTAGWRQDLPLPLVEPPHATHLVSTVAGSILFYNAPLGEGRFARFDDAGYEYTGVNNTFSRDWSHITLVLEDTLLFYNTLSGVGGRSQIDSEGQYRYLGQDLGIPAGWTHITGTISGGLLFYDARSGRGAAAKLGPAGNIQIVQNIPNFSLNWTHIISVNTANLLFYRATDGICGIVSLDGNGTYQYLGAIPNVEPGWTHVVGTPQGGVLFYRSSTGEAVAAHLSTAGQLQFAPAPLQLEPGWTHVVSLPGSTIFFYNALTDAAAYAHLDESGRLHAGDPVDALEPEERSIFFTQLAEIIEIDLDRGVGSLFTRHSDYCYPCLPTGSLLLRLILNSLALLHAEMGRMRESLDLEGLPLIEDLYNDSFCSKLQAWCEVSADLNGGLLFEDDFLYDFFGGAEAPEVIGQWSIVRLYRQLFAALNSWNEAYQLALSQERNGQRGAIRQLLADIERAFRATLDASAVRIDPWITGIAWRRLQELRARSCPDGLGLYAWVDRPYRGTPGPTAGGTLLAPSHAQLLTALILRDKHINDYQAGRWQIELDSHLIRQAKQFADEVRAGAPIQEVLGRAVENIIGSKKQIEQLRLRFCIRDEHAGRRVCDGQKILMTDAGKTFLSGLNLQPEQITALEDLGKVTNTYGDLLVAGAVHAVVSGRPEKAGETMEAAAGLELPPDFDVLRTPHAGNSVNTTVWMVLPKTDQPGLADPEAGPAFLADAAVAAFLEKSVPAAQWTWDVRGPAGTQTVSLADLGLRVPETLAYSEDALRRLAIDHGQATEVLAESEDGQPATPAGQAFHRLQRLVALISGQVQGVQNPQDELSSQQWQEHDQELRARFATLRQAAVDLLAALNPATADASVLQTARRWGIAPAPLDDSLAPQQYQLTDAEQIRHQLTLAHDALNDRLAQVAGIEAGTPLQQIVQAIRSLSGIALPIYGRAPIALLEEFGPLQQNETPGQEWLETYAAVRPALARVEAHQLGPEPPLELFSNPPDGWKARDGGPETSAKQPGNVVVCLSPTPQLSQEVALTVLDGWSEMIPDRRHIVEAAFGFNAPSSRAPQAILLAVTPDETAALDTETLAHIVLQARETAHARMAVPEDLGEFAALFPLAMISGQAVTGVSMQPGKEE